MRFRMIERDSEIGIWLPSQQQWWTISKDAQAYLQGEKITSIIVQEVEAELEQMGFLEQIKSSDYYPVKCIQVASNRKPPTVTIIHSTWDCNIDCPDCYLKKAANGQTGTILDKNIINKYLESFAEIGGLFANISGGEPLLRDDIFEILTHSYRLGLRTCLVTNGTLLNKAIAKKLQSCVDQVTISIDGTETTHDSFRGNANYAKSIEALKLCKEFGISTSATTVLRNLGFTELLGILETLSNLEVAQWNLTALRRPWLRTGTGKTQRPLEPKELLKLGQIAQDKNIEIVADEAILDPSERSKVLTIKVESEEQRWHSTLTVLPNGDVVPCVFHPEKYSDVITHSAKEIADCDERQELLAKTHDSHCKICLS